jgi:hypothetical protein
MRIPALTAAILIATPATAQRITDAHLTESLDLGEELEGRADGDLNGDGTIDTAYVIGSEDARTAYVTLVGKKNRLVGQFKLEPSPLGPAELSIAKGVLKIKDLTGGTTAISATYRYRLDPATRRLRLIGLDATLYSRTYAHDGYEFSWNLLTGAITTVLLKLNTGPGDAAYDRLYETKFKRISKPVYMEDTPDPEMVMVDIRKK